MPRPPEGKIVKRPRKYPVKGARVRVSVRVKRRVRVTLRVSVKGER